EGAVGVVVPLAFRVNTAAATTGADRDRGDAQADRYVRVGRGGRELGRATDRSRRFGGEVYERMFGGELAARPVADRRDLVRERHRARRAARVLLACRGAYGELDLGDTAEQDVGGRGPQVDLEPRLV